MKDQDKAYIYAFLTIFFWSTVATAFKLSLEYLDVFQLLFIATLTSFLIFLIFLITTGQFKFIFHSTKGEILNSVLLGFLNPFFYYVILFKAYSLLPAQVAQPLNMIWPIVLVFLSIPMLGQKIGYRSFIALLISFAGVYLISSEGNPGNFAVSSPFGTVLALGSSVIWSLFWIINLKDKRNEVLKLFMNFFFAMLFVSLSLLLFSDLKTINVAGLAGGIYVGIFEMGISFVFWMKALQYARTTDTISNLIYLSPFISLFFIHLFVGEEIYFTTFIGLFMIVLGILYQKLGKRVI
ncbi:MAG: DMT family transporter [Bacteroidales bacterium]